MSQQQEQKPGGDSNLPSRLPENVPQCMPMIYLTGSHTFIGNQVSAEMRSTIPGVGIRAERAATPAQLRGVNNEQCISFDACWRGYKLVVPCHTYPGKIVYLYLNKQDGWNGVIIPNSWASNALLQVLALTHTVLDIRTTNYRKAFWENSSYPNKSIL